MSIDAFDTSIKYKSLKRNIKLELIKQRLAYLKEQTDLNNEINNKARVYLKNDIYNSPTKPKLSKTTSTLKSKINRDLIKYVRLRESYMQHANYWQQLWLFTDNPLYEHEQCQGFENPIYIYLSNNLKMIDTNIYESLLDLNSNSNCELDLLSSPDSHDSGIHSDERLNRHNIDKTSSNTTSGVESLYSSLISSKKSNDNLNDDSDEQINHVEQHQLTLGWIRCCDESGIYYWHKPSGTVTRKPPNVNNTIIPTKNFDTEEYDSFILSNDDDECTLIEPENVSNKKSNRLNDFTSSTASSSSSSSSSASSSTSSVLETKLRQSQSNIEIKSTPKLTQNNQRFYVRSLGWVKINEEDLTPERSSKAVNKCINDLSRGVKDFNDVVARWGDGKDLYMDLEDNDLILIDPMDEKVLNKLSITSIRVWGVGRDNGRDFAYVARDKHSKIHMCHVIRSDSAPAKEIANALRDTCRRIIQEKNTIKNETCNRDQLKRPDYLPDLVSANKKIDINLRLKSVSFSNDQRPAMMQSTTSFDPTFPTPQEEPKKVIKCRYLGSLQVNRPSGIDILNSAIEKIYNNSFEEYKRLKREKRLSKLKIKLKENDYNEEFINLKLNDEEAEDDEDEYDINDADGDEENAVSFDNLLDLNTERKIGTHVNVVISPSTVSIRKLIERENSSFHSFDFNSEENSDLILECRIRYLCFIGISNDVRLCGFIMHNVDNTFKCHAFLCDGTAGILCKTIEAACKLRYQKCLDAHPEASILPKSLAQNSNSDTNRNSRLLTSYFSNQLRNVFGSFRNRNLFSNLSSSSTASNAAINLVKNNP